MAGGPCPCGRLPNPYFPTSPQATPPYSQEPTPFLHKPGPEDYRLYSQSQAWKNGLHVKCACELYLPHGFVARIKYEQRLDSRHSMNLVYFYYPDAYFTLTRLKTFSNHGFDLLSICTSITSPHPLPSLRFKPLYSFS